jgi:uncharacterized protein (DUF1810 family)
MTLFANVSNDDSIYHQVIEHYFDGEFDSKTIYLINN